MADERDAWLDKDAAESLLRGEPVEAVDERVLAGTERLAETLRDLAAVTYANDTELPGEAAALAAFRRAARASGKTTGTVGAVGAGSGAGVGSDAGAGDGIGAGVGVGVGVGVGGSLLGAVRLAAAPGDAGAPRLGRPVRRGLAVVVAGCALGGIAVVASAGVMPPLFAGEHDPVPANSVSSVTTPGPRLSGPSDGGRDTTGPSRTPGPDREEPFTPHPSSEEGPDGIGGVNAHGESGQGEGALAGSGLSASAQGDRVGTLYRETLDTCRAYRDGTIDAERGAALESAADGAGGAKRFCDRLLGGKDGTGGPDDKGGGGHGGRGDGSGRSGHGDDHGHGPGNGHGNGPGGDGEGGGDGGPVLWAPTPSSAAPTPLLTPVPATSHPDPAPDSGTGPVGSSLPPR
ncbi:hypothetical protein [Streptomyces lushanensis]|uniref:hypothetical protein n=1 Tax=Streptomyces lushanensis TaxID=1434255 RepID=UPI0008328F67|nr:hypothetical protein [Streptomyces lushanensis]